MEYMDAKEVTDVKGIKDAGIRPVDVSNLVSLQLFQNKCGNELFVDTHLTVM
jgi:hypothetical protein